MSSISPLCGIQAHVPEKLFFTGMSSKTITVKIFLKKVPPPPPQMSKKTFVKA